MTTDTVDDVDWTDDSGAINLLEQSKCQHAEDVVAAMYENAERVKGRELSEALDKLDACGELSDVQRDVVQGMVDTIVDQLLAAPMTSIYRAGDISTLDTAVQLFDLEVEVDDIEIHEDGSSRPEVTSDDD